jgi:FAD/FMN-containing dehydrogenase
MEEEHGEAGLYLLKALKEKIDPDKLLNRGVLGL